MKDKQERKINLDRCQAVKGLILNFKKISVIAINNLKFRNIRKQKISFSKRASQLVYFSFHSFNFQIWFPSPPPFLSEVMKLRRQNMFSRLFFCLCFIFSYVYQSC